MVLITFLMTIVIVLESYIYKQLLKNLKHIGNFYEVEKTLNALKLPW